MDITEVRHVLVCLDQIECACQFGLMDMVQVCH